MDIGYALELMVRTLDRQPDKITHALYDLQYFLIEDGFAPPNRFLEALIALRMLTDEGYIAPVDWASRPSPVETVFWQPTERGLLEFREFIRAIKESEEIMELEEAQTTRTTPYEVSFSERLSRLQDVNNAQVFHIDEVSEQAMLAITARSMELEKSGMEIEIRYIIGADWIGLHVLDQIPF